MQIQSEGGSMVLDYYPICDWNNVIDPDKVLKILTFRGMTVSKKVISKNQMGDEILHRIDEHGYIITDNKNGLPQYVTT